MRRRPSCTWLFALSLSLAACNARCGSSDTPVAVAVPPPFVLGPIAAPRVVASRASFDLVATGSGAVLFFAGPLFENGALRAVPLDPRGSARGPELTVVARAPNEPPLLVAEVAAASAGGRLGVAWVAHETPERTAMFATFGGAEAEAFAPPIALGESVVLPRGVRGRLAMSASDDGALTVTVRNAAGPCGSEGGTCARYEHRRIGRSDPAPHRAEANEVRVPCEPFLPGSVWTNGVWYSGVCSASEGAHGHVFVLRAEPPYAADNDGPAGCLPVGLVALDEGAASVSRCAEGLHVAQLGTDGRAVATTTRSVLSTACVSGHPQLRSTGDGVTISLSLEAPQSRLEALLPASLAPEGARAVWTGEALLVAAPQGADVFLRRYVCRPTSRELVRDDDGA